MQQLAQIAESSLGTHKVETVGPQVWQKACWWRLENDYDAVVVFTGPEGSGKSTISYQIACLNDSSFTSRMRTGFGTQEVIEISQKVQAQRTVEMDEGVEGLLNRDAMRKENKDWQKWMVISRQKNLEVHICFPRFESLDLYMREFRVWTWFQITKRGFAWIRVRNWSVPVNDAPYYYQSYPPVSAITFNDMETFAQNKPYVSLDDWKHKQKQKEDYIASFMD